VGGSCHTQILVGVLFCENALVVFGVRIVSFANAVTT
jgi:hypothetical protein